MPKVLPFFLAGAAVAIAQSTSPTSAQSYTASAPIAPDPQAPPIKAGTIVVDRAGVKLGAVQSIAQTSGGLNVVINIDGKLVGVLPSTLKLQGQTAFSSQTKAEILAAAGATR